MTDEGCYFRGNPLLQTAQDLGEWASCCPKGSRTTSAEKGACSFYPQDGPKPPKDDKPPADGNKPPTA
ncbi:predicted protein [Plenodomus lingam JN3]|uniref:Predicted protein n=1 Tax=Leptosphaeria maculans (strain JN3 / isolate v23.1.3 / race Av1-4-5-6-7-8) TaxID=985895 RepID=E5A124_LEPMJ|nr:predicted protein [Plenodomus lingam JN3]CBX97320.1 predicted protein [Plenodomus lingam JN3]